MKQTISVDEVIARTKMQLKLSDTSNDDFIEVLINEGLKHLDTLSITRKFQKCLCIENGKAKLPCNFVKLLGIRYKTTNYDGKPINVSPVYIDKNFLRSCNVPDSTLEVYDSLDDSFQINGGYIYFSSLTEVQEAEIAYLGSNVDENDRMVFYEDYERALKAYACYQFTLAFIENYNQYVVEMYKREWVAQKNWVRGKDAVDEFNKTKFQMGKIFNALLVNRELMTYNSDIW
jgi:hypothetical protein